MSDIIQEPNLKFLRYVFEYKNWNEDDVLNDLLDETIKAKQYFEWNSKQPKIIEEEKIIDPLNMEFSLASLISDDKE